MGKPPVVTVLDYKPSQVQDSLRGFAKIQIGPLVINKCRLVQQDGQAPWVSAPAEKWDPPNGGKSRWTVLVEWPEEWKQPILDAVLAASEWR